MTRRATRSNHRLSRRLNRLRNFKRTEARNHGSAERHDQTNDKDERAHEGYQLQERQRQDSADASPYASSLRKCETRDPISQSGGAGGGDRSQEQQQNNDGDDFRVA